MWSDNSGMILHATKLGCHVVGNSPFKRVFTDDGWKWEKITLHSESEYAEPVQVYPVQFESILILVLDKIEETVNISE